MNSHLNHGVPNLTDLPSVTYDRPLWLDYINKTNKSVDDLFDLVDEYYEDILQNVLGPKQDDLPVAIIMTVVYCIIFLTGLIGNISTCAVVVKNRFMQTTTNYYLFNLAISDLIFLLFGMPTELYSFWSRYPWIFGESFCFIRNMAAETSTLASILTITAFTFERYLAICHLIHNNGLPNLGRVIRVATVIWIVSALCSIPQALQYGVIYHMGREIPMSASCDVKEEGFLINLTLGISTFLFFLLPMAVLTVLYFLIGLAIKKSISHSKRESDHGLCYHSREQVKARLAVIKMLVAVVVAFFVCWTPFHAQRLVRIFLEKHAEFHHTFYKISGVLYYLSATINPILYSIMSRKFRKAFKTTCTHRKRSSSSTPPASDQQHPKNTELIFLEQVALHNVASKMVSRKQTTTGCKL